MKRRILLILCTAMALFNSSVLFSQSSTNMLNDYEAEMEGD